MAPNDFHRVSLLPYHYPKGWGGTGIGNWWGGATFQGLVPYYYFKVASARNPAVEVDRCIYNQMVDREIAPPSRGPPFVGQVCTL